MNGAYGSRGEKVCDRNTFRGVVRPGRQVRDGVDVAYQLITAYLAADYSSEGRKEESLGQLHRG